MTERESIIERLLKIKALAERGVGGERSAAERLLNSLMKQYDISPEDLGSDMVEYHLAYIGEQSIDWKLFSQIAHKLHEGRPGKVKLADLRNAPAHHRRAWAEAGLGPKNSNIGLYCTKAEFVEVMSTFEIYRDDMHRQEEAFFYACLDKNNLLMAPDGDQPELTEEEIEKLKAAALMSIGIQKKDVYKQIEGI